MDLVEFDGLALATAPGRVMTPRPASEQLVAAASACVGGRRARIADVGTGSGALAIAIARRCANAELWASDTSVEACRLAEENARRHGLSDRVFVRRGDLLSPLPGRFDVIVANLPYLPAATAPSYPDLAGEPSVAVFAPGDGLDPYRRLVSEASARLVDRGLLLLQLDGDVVAAEPNCLGRLPTSIAPPLPPAPLEAAA